MLNEAIKERLRDPAYLRLHMQAVRSIQHVGTPKWYDAHFHRRYEVAKHYLACVRPDALEDFVSGFAPFKPPPGFAVKTIDALFDPQTHARIREVAHSIPEALIERHETEFFGRTVVHDHPYFSQLQSEILPRVSALLGQELDCGYNFLSLYGGEGICNLHMDEPISMYTLDYCIDQTVEWPIRISRPVDWPTLEEKMAWSRETIFADETLDFRPYVLTPNNAIIFNGSSQWHYRERIPEGGQCSLLFFHFRPAGCEDLVLPHKWADYFDIEELGPLCELFTTGPDDGFF